MGISLAWSNTFENKKRFITAASGIAFAILLIFMQLGFLNAAGRNAAFIYHQLDGDIAIVSASYSSMINPGKINIYRIPQARNVAGVKSATGIYFKYNRWINRINQSRIQCLVLGIDPADITFKDSHLMGTVSRIAERDTVLVDQLTSDDYGPRAPGDTVKINKTELTMTGDFQLGSGILAKGLVIVNQPTFQRIHAGITDYHLGLIKVNPEATISEVVHDLKNKLPNDIAVYPLKSLIDREENYFVSVKPVGILFKIGVIVAFLIGFVILYQVLSTEITTRLSEFSTLKAIGLSHFYIYKVGLQQGLIFSFTGYLVAFILANGLYNWINELVHLPIFMDVQCASLVFGLTMLMCCFAVIPSLNKVRKADPAELFK